ncbi:MAG: SH3 domain-containing protein [Chloroflexi bacterium]|nr:SH3 domain-containing protein [Chloroflexota bacterium]
MTGLSSPAQRWLPLICVLLLVVACAPMPPPTVAPTTTPAPTATSPPAPSISEGTVRHAITGHPLANAQVRSSLETVTTDSEGYFRVRATEQEQLQVSAPGFEPKSVYPLMQGMVTVNLVPGPEETLKLIHRWLNERDYDRAYDLLHPHSKQVIEKEAFAAYQEATRTYEVLRIDYEEVRYLDTWIYRGRSYGHVAEIAYTITGRSDGQEWQRGEVAHLAQVDGIWHWFHDELPTPTPTPSPIPPTPTPRPPTPTPKPSPTPTLAERIRQLSKSLVLIIPGPGMHPPSGTGVIIRSDGLILANYEQIGAPPLGAEVLVYRSASPEQLADLAYYAEVLSVDLTADLVLLQITRDADYRPLTSVTLPAVRLGDATSVRTGDELLLMGYRDKNDPILRSGLARVISGIFVGDEAAALEMDATSPLQFDGIVAFDSSNRLVGQANLALQPEPPPLWIIAINRAADLIAEMGGMFPIGSLARVDPVSAWDGLNMRTGPGVHNPKFYTIPPNGVVTILDGPVDVSGSPWYLVRDAVANKQGWVNGRYLLPFALTAADFFDLYWVPGCDPTRLEIALRLPGQSGCDPGVETRDLDWLADELRDLGILKQGEWLVPVSLGGKPNQGLVIRNKARSRLGWIRIGGGKPGSVWRITYYRPGKQIGPRCWLRTDYTWQCE